MLHHYIVNVLMSSVFFFVKSNQAEIIQRLTSLLKSYETCLLSRIQKWNLEKGTDSIKNNSASHCPTCKGRHYNNKKRKITSEKEQHDYLNP